MLSQGLFIKLRHAFPHPGRIARALRTHRADDLTVSRQARIVVVGAGTAALSCLRELQAEQFRNVTVVAKDDLFGGKCVNSGCMPVEFALTLGDTSGDDARTALRDFVTSLRGDVQKQFAATGYPLITGTAQKIVGHNLHLADGRTVPFDRLILAIGNSYPQPAALAGLSNVVSIDQFWDLPAGSRLTIYSDGNVAALTLADVARCQGLVPTVVQVGKVALAPLPSYRYFLRNLADGGIKVHDKARLISADAAQMVVAVNNKPVPIAHDYVVVCSNPTPHFLEVDGKVPSVYDLDLVRACLPARPDVVFLGDGGGLLTSSEADLHAKLLFRAWKYGQHPDFHVVGAMPLRLHAQRSLALVGPEWSYTAKNWQEADFRSLGWSKITGLEGKLWYLLDQDSGKVEAMHICHKQAGELICVAAALMPFPVWDPRWLASFVHPAGAEIFKVVAEQALRALPPPGENRIGPSATEWDFLLPPLEQLDVNKGLPDWMDRQAWLQAVMSTNPRMWFAMFFGLAQLEKATGATFTRRFVQHADHAFALADTPAVTIDYAAAAQICYVRHGKWVINVDCRPQ